MGGTSSLEADVDDPFSPKYHSLSTKMPQNIAKKRLQINMTSFTVFAHWSTVLCVVDPLPDLSHSCLSIKFASHGLTSDKTPDEERR